MGHRLHTPERPWIGCTDLITWDYDGYDLLYDPASGAVLLAAEQRSWALGVQELAYLYD